MRNCKNCDYCESTYGDLVRTNDKSERLADFVRPYQVCDGLDGYDEDE